MHAVNDLTPEMLSRFTKLDYDREMAFAAFTRENDEEKILGVSRYSINPDKMSCEFAIAIADEWQGLGLARQLMLILIEHVKNRDLTLIEGTVLKNNTAMDKLMESLGFKKSASPDDYDINIYRREIK
jgi:acetyltransferase